ncbi:hypothetical protein CROQUDRAFT_650545 [Cronartium quercuum f. sp. fusiforme G11]|uniref:Uncharacterized protein n=1 Tax=Cronartium quercuum f. sp. fusiforme G11 TaxID=708437 RepID=A0A9P6TGZ4_9BASI|nr:hypothetical protein CROQUDRAFT_650545 [Cronartium quercuum f. sp. fusiforme G11]
MKGQKVMKLSFIQGVFHHQTKFTIYNLYLFCLPFKIPLYIFNKLEFTSLFSINVLACN